MERWLINAVCPSCGHFRVSNSVLARPDLSVDEFKQGCTSEKASAKTLSPYQPQAKAAQWPFTWGTQWETGVDRWK